MSSDSKNEYEFISVDIGFQHYNLQDGKLTMRDQHLCTLINGDTHSVNQAINILVNENTLGAIDV